MRNVIAFPGQKVIATTGEVVTVALVECGQVYAFGRNGLPKPVKICTDAFGGEHDQTMGLAA